MLRQPSARSVGSGFQVSPGSLTPSPSVGAVAAGRAPSCWGAPCRRPPRDRPLGVPVGVIFAQTSLAFYLETRCIGAELNPRFPERTETRARVPSAQPRQRSVPQAVGPHPPELRSSSCSCSRFFTCQDVPFHGPLFWAGMFFYGEAALQPIIFATKMFAAKNACGRGAWRRPGLASARGSPVAQAAPLMWAPPRDGVPYASGPWCGVHRPRWAGMEREAPSARRGRTVSRGPIAQRGVGAGAGRRWTPPSQRPRGEYTGPGGGALLCSPLAVRLLASYHTCPSLSDSICEMGTIAVPLPRSIFF